MLWPLTLWQHPLWPLWLRQWPAELLKPAIALRPACIPLSPSPPTTCRFTPVDCPKPWIAFAHAHAPVQAIFDQIYAAGEYEVTRRLQTWRNNIATKASEALERFINVDHKDDLPTKELIADQIEAYLEKKPVYPGSELHTYAYQWAEWNCGIDSKGFGEGALVLSTFVNGHLAQLGQFDEDLEKEKLVGALILAMQAVGQALEQWRTGELVVSKDKLKHFSADNYGDVTKKKGDNSKKMIRIRRATVFVCSLRELAALTGRPSSPMHVNTSSRQGVPGLNSMQ